MNLKLWKKVFLYPESQFAPLFQLKEHVAPKHASKCGSRIAQNHVMVQVVVYSEYRHGKGASQVHATL